MPLCDWSGRARRLLVPVSQRKSARLLSLARRGTSRSWQSCDTGLGGDMKVYRHKPSSSPVLAVLWKFTTPFAAENVATEKKLFGWKRENQNYEIGDYIGHMIYPGGALTRCFLVKRSDFRRDWELVAE